jgi:hypothetical protein
VSTQDRGPDDRPSKDGPLKYAPKDVRHVEPEPNPAGAPGTDDVAPLHQGPAPRIQAPEPTEQPWKQLDQRPVFAGDVVIVERGNLAPSDDRKYVLARRLAGVAIVTAVGFIGYRLGSS